MKIMNVRSMLNMTANENDKDDENKETDAYYKMMKIVKDEIEDHDADHGTWWKRWNKEHVDNNVHEDNADK